MTEGWTLSELVEQVGAALDADAVRAPNGRIRDLPDARAIRWYATIGLVDRPLPGSGRTARYGSRHLLQLVAIKRRQAQGRSLAQIQTELAGATDDILRGVARLPRDLAPAPAPSPEPASDSPGHPSVETRPKYGARRDPATGPDAEVGPSTVDPARARFWATAPAAVDAQADEPGTLGLLPPRRAAGQPAPSAPALTVRYQIDLPGGATLGLPYRPDPDDLAAIDALAAPLVALLAERGLLASIPPGLVVRPPAAPAPTRHEGDSE